MRVTLEEHNLQFVATIAERADITLEESRRFLTAFAREAAIALALGADIKIRGFGTFKIARDGDATTVECAFSAAYRKKSFSSGGEVITQYIQNERRAIVEEAFRASPSEIYKDPIFPNFSGASRIGLSISAKDSAKYGVKLDFLKSGALWAAKEKRVFFATCRNWSGSGKRKPRFESKRADLTYGAVDVTIPRNHKMGEIEKPSITKLELSTNPNKHFAVNDISTECSVDHYDRLEKELANASQSSALVYIHGYNSSFEDAAFRTAQLANDLDFKGIPLFFSWPSKAKFYCYTVDEQAIEWATPLLENYLLEVAKLNGLDSIYVIGHSMGTRALTRALSSLYRKDLRASKKFQEIILAAPDIDADVFERDILPNIVTPENQVTLYATSNDKALRASLVVHGNTRAGRSSGEILVYTGMESIDASSVDSGFLQHSAYATRTIVSDMYYIFSNRLRAAFRAGLQEREHSSGAKYWEIVA